MKVVPMKFVIALFVGFVLIFTALLLEMALNKVAQSHVLECSEPKLDVSSISRVLGDHCYPATAGALDPVDDDGLPPDRIPGPANFQIRILGE